MNKKLVSIVLVFSMLSVFMPGMVALSEKEDLTYDETKDYAEIVFGDTVETTNIKKWEYQDGGSIVEYDGEKGARLGTGVVFNIDDRFMYNIPENEEVIVTVKLYEDARVNMYAHYHAHGTSNTFASTEEKQTVHRIKEPILISGDKNWKTVSFSLKDFLAGNGLQGWADMRIVKWREDLGDHGLSGKLIIHSIRVEYRKWPSPLRLTKNIYFEKVGHMFSAKDKMPLLVPMKNKSETEEITVKWQFNIYNSNDVLISATEYECALKAGEERVDKVFLPNPAKNDVYYVVGESETATGTDNTNFVKDDAWTKTDFSVSYIFKSNELNFNVGMNTHMGNHAVIAEILTDIGIGWVREGQATRNIAGQKVNDKYTMGGNLYNKLKPYKDAGMKVMLEARPLIYEENHYLVKKTYKNSYGGTNDDSLPRTDEEAENFANIIADLTEESLPYIDNLEIFNEPEISDSNKVDGKQYANIVKKVYEKVKRFAPDLDISGIAMTNYYEHMQIPFYEEGGLDCLDQYTIHRYDWSGAFDPYQYGYVYPAQHKELLSKYKDIPLWSTESGFISQDMHKEGKGKGKNAWSTLYPDGVPRHMHARNFTLSTAAYAGFDQYEKWFWHVATDFGDPTEREDSFGMFNTYMEDTKFGYTPYTAKPAAVAIAATNHFIPDDAITKGIYGDSKEGLWGFCFHSDKNNEDVLVIQSQYGKRGNIAFKLGCTAVDIYDIYGNFLGKMCAEDGIYSFEITEEPYYVVGNFTDFEKAQKGLDVVPVCIQTDCVNGDVVEFVFKRNTNQDYSISVDRLEVVENRGFVGDTAIVRVKAPSWDYSTAYCNITVCDGNGNLCLFVPGEIEIKDPIDMTVERIKLSDKQNTHWEILATVRNNATTSYADGTVRILEPSYITNINRERTFKALAPKQTIKYVFKVPEMVNKEFIDFKTEVALENGFKKEIESTMDFTTAKYAYEKPVIDGVQTPGEWTGSWFGVKNANKLAEHGAGYLAKWSGPEDLSLNAQIMWDEENMYFLGVVNDDINYNGCKDAASNLWQGDSIQIAIDDEEEINSVLTAKFTEIGLGEATDFGVGTWAWNMRYEDYRMNKSLENDEHAIKHYDGYTVYEWKIPWTELFYADYEMNPNIKFRIAILVNDDDGPGRIAIEYGGGIANSKDATQFARIEFTR